MVIMGMKEDYLLWSEVDTRVDFENLRVSHVFAEDSFETLNYVRYLVGVIASGNLSTLQRSKWKLHSISVSNPAVVPKGIKGHTTLVPSFAQGYPNVMFTTRSVYIQHYCLGSLLGHTFHPSVIILPPPPPLWTPAAEQRKFSSQSRTAERKVVWYECKNKSISCEFVGYYLF